MSAVGVKHKRTVPLCSQRKNKRARKERGFGGEESGLRNSERSSPPISRARDPVSEKETKEEPETLSRKRVRDPSLYALTTFPVYN